MEDRMVEDRGYASLLGRGHRTCLLRVGGTVTLDGDLLAAAAAAAVVMGTTHGATSD